MDGRASDSGFEAVFHKRLCAHFKGLTRLEIHGAMKTELVHHYLSTSSGARQLVARDVFIPVRLLEDQGGNLSWICKDLVTLEYRSANEVLCKTNRRIKL